jgi:hypothetical protein
MKRANYGFGQDTLVDESGTEYDIIDQPDSTLAQDIAAIGTALVPIASAAKQSIVGTQAVKTAGTTAVATSNTYLYIGLAAAAAFAVYWFFIRKK